MRRFALLIALLVCGWPTQAQISLCGNTAAVADSTGTTEALAFPSAITAGRGKVVSIEIANSTSVPTVSDDNGGSYTQVRRDLVTGTLQLVTWVAFNANAGATTVTVSALPDGTFRQMTIAECPGITNVDRSAFTSGNNSTPASPEVQTGVASELVYGFVYAFGGSVAAGSGFTALGAPSGSVMAINKVVASTGIYDANWTAATGAWHAHIVTFSGSSPPTPPPDPRNAGIPVIELPAIPRPPNPTGGVRLLYNRSTTGKVECLNPDGTSCYSVSGAAGGSTGQLQYRDAAGSLAGIGAMVVAEAFSGANLGAKTQAALDTISCGTVFVTSSGSQTFGTVTIDRCQSVIFTGSGSFTLSNPGIKMDAGAVLEGSGTDTPGAHTNFVCGAGMTTPLITVDNQVSPGSDTHWSKLSDFRVECAEATYNQDLVYISRPEEAFTMDKVLIFGPGPPHSKACLKIVGNSPGSHSFRNITAGGCGYMLWNNGNGNFFFERLKGDVHGIKSVRLDGLGQNTTFIGLGVENSAHGVASAPGGEAGSSHFADIAASPTGATESGNTVTITTTTNHGFAAGQTVYISDVLGAGLNAGYKGQFTVATTPTATTFTYTNPTAGLPASGGGEARSALTLSSCTESVNTVTCTTAQNMTADIFYPGQIVEVSGVDVAGYNGFWEIATKPTSTTFTYTNPTGGLGAGSGGVVNQTAKSVVYIDTSQGNFNVVVIGSAGASGGPPPDGAIIFEVAPNYGGSITIPMIEYIGSSFSNGPQSTGYQGIIYKDTQFTPPKKIGLQGFGSAARAQYWSNFPMYSEATTNWTAFKFEDEFYRVGTAPNDIGNQGGQLEVISGGTSTVAAYNCGGLGGMRPGCIEITTPATSGQGAALTWSPGGIGFIGSNTIQNAGWDSAYYFTLSETTNTGVRVGLAKGGQANQIEPTDAYYFRYDTALGDVNWMCVDRRNSVSTVYDTGIAASTNPVTLRIRAVAGGRGGVFCQVNYGSEIQIATTVISSIGNAVTPFLGIRTNTSAARHLVIDRVEFQQVGMNSIFGTR